jgi:hypothetical protein
LSWIAGDAVQHYEMGVSWDSSRRARGAVPAVRYVDPEEVKRIAKNCYTSPARKLLGSQLVLAAGVHRCTCNQNKKPAWHACHQGFIISDDVWNEFLLISNVFSVKKVFVKALLRVAKGGVRQHCVLRPCGVAGAHKLRHAMVWFLTLLRNDPQARGPHWIRTGNGTSNYLAYIHGIVTFLAGCSKEPYSSGNSPCEAMPHAPTPRI